MKCVLNVCAKHPWDDMRVYDKIAKVLQSFGHEVHNTAPNCVSRVTEHHIHIHGFSQKEGMSGRIWSLFRLYRLIEEIHPRVMIAHEPDALVVAYLYSRQKKIPLVYDCHEAYEHWYEGTGFKCVLAKIINRLVSCTQNFIVKRIYAVTSVNQTMTLRFKKYNQNSHFLPNLPDLNLRVSTTPKRPSYEMVYFGQFGRSKQVEMFVGAAAILKAKGQPGRITVIGGDSDVQAENNYFRTEIKEKSLEEYFEFLPWMPREKAFKILNSFSVGLMRFDSYTMPGNYALPNKLFEYMALGLCVVGCELNIEVAAILQKEQCGLLIPAEEGQALADVWMYAIQHGDEVTQRGIMGKKAIRQTYNWGEFGKVLDDIINHS